jgi:hypothetical protein
VKSASRLDAEIQAVSEAWNSSTDPKAHTDEVASAIYHTLRWARGLRETLPSQNLLIRMAKAGTLPGYQKETKLK